MSAYTGPKLLSCGFAGMGIYGGWSFDRMLLGYHLELDDNMSQHVKGDQYETWYWHNYYILFLSFHREAKGPINLRIKP